MEAVPDRISFPGEEDRILRYWEEIDAFRESLRRSVGRPPYTFYDGPPFATGLPHYGHILAGTIKDIVTRYAHQTGHFVQRRFGWDCHGLPIEFEIEQELGLKTREDVLNYGIANYNRECRGIVMRYAQEWKSIVTRMGRWIDFDNDYKTMNLSYMESVWWVFKELFDKNLVYLGFKVMPYSVGCTTPLSNFEANMNYKEVHDPAVIITFPLEEEPETSFLAWTTTPWTLPSNLCLCVNPSMEYVKIKDINSSSVWIVARSRLQELYKDEKKKKKKDSPPKYTVLEEYKGEDLVGKKYIPLFEYFGHFRDHGAFRVVSDGYVTDDSGTGIVHCAPGFGEDDYRVCLKFGIIEKDTQDVPCPVDPSGRFTSEVTDYVGVYVKDTDKSIIKVLKERGRLVTVSSIVHSYPFCWRSETPLIYKTVPSWFVAVEKIKETVIKSTEETYWVPSFVKEKRFANWLQDARDWAVSRNRYWGTPIPLWTSEDFSEVICVGSIEELKELTGIEEVTDLHRENIDDITIKSPKTGKVLKRIQDVFDCWFESGSMPYAERHYPFEGKEKFAESFPADFIGEGLDQTRGWFYTLMVLSSALFEKPAFKNLIVNGLVLAEDGRKMSKRLKNYPDPIEVIGSYGADALRLYLINSPVVRAEPLRFKESGVRDVVKDVFLPWFNAYRFFVQNVSRLEKNTKETFVVDDLHEIVPLMNIMDKWIVGSSQTLLRYIHDEMAAYRLYTVVPRLVRFLDDLTNWYVRLNRQRLKGVYGNSESHVSLSTLFTVLMTVCKVMAPFTPFLTEYLYQNLKKLCPSEKQMESVHFEMIPDPIDELIDEELEISVRSLQSVVQLGRVIRDRNGVQLKKPLRECVIIHPDEEHLTMMRDHFEEYIKKELNLVDVRFSKDEQEYVSYKLQPNYPILGKKHGKKFPAVNKALRELENDDIVKLLHEGTVSVVGEEVSKEEVNVIRSPKSSMEFMQSDTDGTFVLMLSMKIDDGLISLGVAREIVSSVQQLRKKCDLHISDDIEVFFSTKDETVAKIVTEHSSYIKSVLRSCLVDVKERGEYSVMIGEGEFSLMDGSKVTLQVCRKQVSLLPSIDQSLKLVFCSKDYHSLLSQLNSEGRVVVNVDGKEHVLELGKDVFLSTGARLGME